MRAGADPEPFALPGGYTLSLGERPASVAAYEDPQETRFWLNFPQKEAIASDLVVAAVGITARDELAVAAGLERSSAGGVVIDETCAASAENVWAIGEVASFDGICMGLVAPANAMAEVVADRLCGGEASFEGFDTAAKLKLAGMDVASFGDTLGTSPHALEVTFADAFAKHLSEAGGHR